MEEVIITVCGGAIQQIEAPDNCRIIVRDYDEADALREANTQPIGDAVIKADDNGDEYVEAVWKVVNKIDEEENG